jgi:serine/threonine-protein kinase PpkA
MEYFPLGHLGTRLGQALPPADALRYTQEIAHALSIIHAAGIVHRDLKPANIMLRETATVALIDFGISSSDAVNSSGERDGAAITGTPYYMSPEQASGAPTDERTDLYALGIILYHMLTGEKPYVGDTPHAILDQHREAPLPRLPKYLAALQPLLDCLLVKDAQQRLANARELIEAIDKMSHATQQIQRLEVAVGST